MLSFTLFGQNCPDDINDSPGNSPNTLTATVYDEFGNEIQEITCETTGNSNQIDCDLDSYGFPDDFFVLIEISNGPNTTECAYDENGELMNNNPLPAELVDFSVSATGGDNELSWTTASETNNDFFTVQHSRDGSSWNDIEHVQGMGTTSEKNMYQTYHRRVNAGINYYRLKQTDFNGESEWLEIRSVQNEGVTVTMKSGNLSVSADQQIIRVMGVDLTGKSIMEKNSCAEKSLTFSLNNEATSIVIVQVYLEDGNVVRKKVALY